MGEARTSYEGVSVNEGYVGKKEEKQCEVNVVVTAVDMKLKVSVKSYSNKGAG